MIKKGFKLFLIITLAFSFFLPIINVKAKTLRDIQNELKKLEDEKAYNEKQEAEIEARINRAKAQIVEIGKKITKNNKDQATTNAEIEELEKEIALKKKQIKELIAFNQLAGSENFYLKYLFGADSFTDFIYRFAVIEQLTAKSDELVKEMNGLVKKNEQKLKDLEKQKQDLKRLNEQVQGEIAKLGKEQSKFIEQNMDIDTEIKIVKTNIKRYEDQGCKPDDDLSRCNSEVPFDYGFDRPVKKGVISDEFGLRIHPIYGTYSMHNGIDIAGNSEGTPVYAPAAGKVTDIMVRYYCGGNIITMNHNIEGVYYTTRYLHLLTMNVKVGDIVSKGEQIGTVGGGPKTWAYETCSSGAHLHFEMAKGHYYGTGSNSYQSWNTYVSKAFNPRNMVYFPKYGVWF